MVKVYYAYKHSKTVGQYCSRGCNFIIDHARNQIISGANQNISISNIKTGQHSHFLSQTTQNTPVRHLHLSSTHLFAGYEDGSIFVYLRVDWSHVTTLVGHTAPVTCISTELDGTRMASAGMDGKIIIWDLLSEESWPIENAHGNAVMQIEIVQAIWSGKPGSVVASVGKDGFFKLFDMASRLCLAAISTQSTEALCFYFSVQRSLFYVGTNKESIPLIKLNSNPVHAIGLVSLVGIFARKNFSRCNQMQCEGGKLYILNGEKSLQVYEVMGDGKVKMRIKRLIKRKKEGTQGKEEIQTQNEGKEVQSPQFTPNQYELHLNFVQQKPLHFKVYNFTVHSHQILLNSGTQINSLQPLNSLTPSIPRVNQLTLSHPFLLARTANNVNVLSAGNFQSLFTIKKKVKSCCVFVGGWALIVEEERVAVWDLRRGEEVAALQQQFEGGFGKGKNIMLWKQNEISFFQVGSDKKNNIKFKHISSKSFPDKITNAIYTHSSTKYILTLQTPHIHINHSDTNRSFLQLYGHKLPITSFDVDSTDQLLVTGSRDKDMKFWDMEFGHCIKSIFAHASELTCVKFIKNTHYVLSAGKDGHVKFWDGDLHTLIMDFEESTAEVSSLAIADGGQYFIAGGFDGGFRVYQQTEEQVVATDQEERRYEKVMVEEYAVQKMGKQKYEELKHGEEIIQALQNKQQPTVILKLLKKIPSATLSSSLSFLHSAHVELLQSYLSLLISHQHQTQLCFRVLAALPPATTSALSTERVKLVKQMRQGWADLRKMLRGVRQGLRLIGSIQKEEKIGF